MNWKTMASISNQSGKSGTSGAEELLRASVRDALRLSDLRHSPRFIGFLDERQKQIARTEILGEDRERVLFWGGFPDAERTFLGAFPVRQEPSENAFPIRALAFRYRRGISLNHRDFLGTLLSCGVKRETIGDILCGDGFTVAFVEKGMADYLSGQITKVGGEGVTLDMDYEGELPVAHSFREIRDTVASPRLDSVVKVAAGVSREEAARLIAAGQVSVNHNPNTSVSAVLKERDTLSIRGVGRFILETLGPQTRKGRLFVTIKKYS